MTEEYVGSFETEFGLRHNLTKYILRNGVEVILNEEEMEELFGGSKLGSEIVSLKAENQKLEHQKEYYRGLILDFKSVLNQMEKVRWENLL